MGSLKITSYIDCHGPLFTGQAEEAVKRFCKDATKAIAQRGADLLRAFPMNKTGRARGTFQSHLQVVQRSAGYAVPGPQITGVVWSPWLEGTSKRNSDTTFRGYHLFRKTRLQLNKEAGEIAERELQRFLPEMGGD